MTDLLDEIALGVEPEAFARSRSSSSSGSLLRRRFTNRTNEQTLDPNPRIVDLLFTESRIDDVNDSIDGQRSFGDISGNDDFSPGRSTSRSWRRSLVEDLLLLLRRERGVERNGAEGSDRVREVVRFHRDLSTGVLDLFFSSEEDENVSFWLRLMNHEDRSNGRFEIIGFRFGSVESVLIDSSVPAQRSVRK